MQFSSFVLFFFFFFFFFPCLYLLTDDFLETAFSHRDCATQVGVKGNRYREVRLGGGVGDVLF